MVGPSKDMEHLEVVLPAELRKVGGWTKVQFAEEVRFLMAAELFALHKVSIGRASGLSGLPIAQFMTRVSAMGIDVIDLDDEELRQEFRPRT